MDKEVIVRLNKNFEDYAHKEKEVEFWYARDLQVLLGYDKWENFSKVIDKAKIACTNSKVNVADHFPDVRKMVEIGSQTTRNIEDIKLTRYACYLIAQNGDPRKEEIAFAQSYFALQTRKQELVEKRIALQERFASGKNPKMLKRDISLICLITSLRSDTKVRHNFINKIYNSISLEKLGVI